jgi:Protein of unknown function (DUF2914)
MKTVLSALAAIVVAFAPFAAGAAEDQAAGSLQVAEAKLGKGVQDRQITEEATTFAVNDKVYLWLKVTGGPAELKVNWKIDDQTDAVSLKIGGSPWRTWSTKTAFKAGDWTVTVTDAGGQVLKEMKFTVQ